MRASTKESPRTAAVSVYLHPGETSATFSGTVTIEFVDGPVGTRGYEMVLSDYQVDPGQRPPGVASADLVTAVPGEYRVLVALHARTAGRREPHEISLAIPVRVLAPP